MNEIPRDKGFDSTLTGKEAVKLFCDEDCFTRIKAAPGRIQKTLFGQGGVQELDGEQHRCRKAMFLSITSDERLAGLARISAHCSLAAARRWASTDRVVLYEAAQEILTRAVCRGVGVTLAESEIHKRTTELTALSTTRVLWGQSIVGPGWHANDLRVGRGRSRNRFGLGNSRCPKTLRRTW